MSFPDSVCFTATSGGTGTFDFGSALPSFSTPTQGVTLGELTDGQTDVPYFATDSLSSPTVRVYGHSPLFAAAGGGSFTRDPSEKWIDSGGVGTGPYDFGSPPIVGLGVLGADIARPSDIPSADDPTATASDTAVNGSASTFMRSDAAPAVQKASAAQFGIVKVDGSTITETGGVISATGGGGGSPGGSSGDIQYNNAGGFEGAANFTIDGSGNPNVVAGASYDYGGSPAFFLNSASPASAFIGGAGNFTSTATNNFGMGSLALSGITVGINNVAIGVDALPNLTSGSENVALGHNAANQLIATDQNFALGSGAMLSATSNVNCIAIGFEALRNGDHNSNHVAIGKEALANINSTQGVVVIGGEGPCQNSGAYGTCVGSYAGGTLSTGDRNTFLGAAAGYGITTGRANTVIGSQTAGLTSSASNCIVLEDGDGNIGLDFNYTTPSVWTFASKIAVPGGTNPLLTSTSAITSGAGSGAGTLTNAPTAGDPTKWFAINDAGTTRYVPAW